MFKTIAQFKAAYGGVQRTMNFETWQPFVAEAREQFFVDVLGYEFLEYLETKINDTLILTGTPTAYETRVIGMLRMSLAAYADFVGSFRMMQTVGDAGKTVATPANQQAPGKWLSVASRNDAITRGDLHLERALKYMEANVAQFTIWKNSGTFTIKTDCLISSADMLTDYFPNCKGSRRMYLAMLPYLMQAQSELGGIITDTQAAAVIANAKLVANGTAVVAKDKELIEFARKVIVPRAVEKAILYVNINEDWRLVSETDGIVNENVLSMDIKNGIGYRENANYLKAKAGILEFLYKNASGSVFVPFFDSDLYDVLVAKDGPKKVFENKKKNRFAIL